MIYEANNTRYHVNIVEAEINTDGEVTEVNSLRFYDESNDAEWVMDNPLSVKIFIDIITAGNKFDELEAEYLPEARAEKEVCEAEHQAECMRDDKMCAEGVW